MVTKQNAGRDTDCCFITVLRVTESEVTGTLQQEKPTAVSLKLCVLDTVVTESMKQEKPTAVSLQFCV